MAGEDQQHAAYLPPGVSGTVVSKADRDGNPTSFDPMTPSVVHVDPDEPDGGVVLDMSKVSSEDMTKALTGAELPHEAYYNLKAIAEDGGDSSPTESREGAKEPMKPLPPVKLASEPTAPEPPAPEPAPSPGWPPHPDQAAKMDQLAAGMSAMMTKLEQLESRAATPDVVPEPVEPVEPDVLEESDPLEDLEMPFLSGGKPQRAKQVVYFDMGVLGNMMSRYHAVIEGNDCVVLVYDTRYEDGQQWIPPDRGDEPFWLQIENEKKKFLCSSLGLHFNIGVLDVTVLVKNPDPNDYSGVEGDE